jgi:uncharacterized membrane protein
LSPATVSSILEGNDVLRTAIVRGVALLAVVVAAGCAHIVGDARDRTLEYQLADRLASDPALAFVTVGIRGRTAYVAGWVSKNASAQQAERFAADVPEITRVYNAIAVGIYHRDP